jgi:hypothetical protein
MDGHIPDELLASIRTHGPKSRTTRFRVRSGADVYDLLELRPNGFEIASDGAPHLRGYVDLMHGATRLAHCLILQAEEADGIVSYEFKLRTEDLGAAPVDYDRAPDGPVALLER